MQITFHLLLAPYRQGNGCRELPPPEPVSGGTLDLAFFLSVSPTQHPRRLGEGLDESVLNFLLG